MKKRNWLLLLLIVLCLAAFFGYRKLDQLRTDTRAPQIHIDEQPLEVSVRDDKSALLAGVTASDNVDGDVTASLVVERVTLTDSDGSISVSYAAFDSAGNVAKAKREGRYTDYERPRFTLNAPLVYTVDHSFDVLSNVGAVDAIDGDIQHRVRATTKGTSSIMALGSHMVQFQVTNSLGDTVGDLPRGGDLLRHLQRRAGADRLSRLSAEGRPILPGAVSEILHMAGGTGQSGGRASHGLLHADAGHGADRIPRGLHRGIPGDIHRPGREKSRF